MSVKSFIVNGEAWITIVSPYRPCSAIFSPAAEASLREAIDVPVFGPNTSDDPMIAVEKAMLELLTFVDFNL
jgi:hypothetical protein